MADPVPGTQRDGPLVCVFGAGSIGCYVGGRLAATGTRVRFIGRQRIKDALARDGLVLRDMGRTESRLESGDIDFVTGAEGLADAGLVLVTVKAGDTADAGAAIVRHAPKSAVVVSLQNGIGNEDTLREALPDHTVLAGMVPFNVVVRPGGAFKQATEGGLDIEANSEIRPWLPRFAAAGLPVRLHEKFRPVQWAKLLLNLNNAVSGLSGLSLREELSQRPYRLCLAMAQREALAALDKAGISPARLTPLPPAWIPALLSLPDFLFTRIAGHMLAIDPDARSSMIDALDAGRKTDIDWLNGEVVRLGERHGIATPVNRRLVELVHAMEAGPRRRWSGEDLIGELRSTRQPLVSDQAGRRQA